MNPLMEKSSVELNMENDQHDIFQLQDIFDDALSSTLVENVKDILEYAKGMHPNSSWIGFNKGNHYNYPKYYTIPLLPKKDIASCSEDKGDEGSRS